MHYTFEAWLNYSVVPIGGKEMQLFLKFVKTLGGLKVFRTEWTVFGEDPCVQNNLSDYAIS